MQEGDQLFAARAAEVTKLPWIRQEKEKRLVPGGGPDMKMEVSEEDRRR